MIKKSKRATSSHIDELARGRKTLHGGFFTLSLRYMDKMEEMSRFAVVISKKVAPTAVSRNKLKRQAYSVISELVKPDSKGIIAVLYAKKEAKTAKYPFIARDIANLLVQANIVSYE